MKAWLALVGSNLIVDFTLSNIFLQGSGGVDKSVHTTRRVPVSTRWAIVECAIEKRIKWQLNSHAQTQFSHVWTQDISPPPPTPLLQLPPSNSPPPTPLLQLSSSNSPPPKLKFCCTTIKSMEAEIAAEAIKIIYVTCNIHSYICLINNHRCLQ